MYITGRVKVSAGKTEDTLTGNQARSQKLEKDTGEDRETAGLIQ
jgi:hypothetical protein